MIFWILWFVVGVVGTLCFSTAIIPKIMRKTYAATLTVRAKAIERCKNELGDVVVYRPSFSARQYIKQYRICRDEGGVYFSGEIARKVAFAEYELTVYNADNDVIQILRVKEKFNDTGETSIIRLLDKTDYVGLRLICIDDNPIPAERKAFNGRYAIYLALLCACLSVAVDILVWLTLSFILRYRDGFAVTSTLSVTTWVAILGFTALGVTLITCALSLGEFFLRKRGDLDE